MTTERRRVPAWLPWTLALLLLTLLAALDPREEPAKVSPAPLDAQVD